METYVAGHKHFKRGLRQMQVVERKQKLCQNLKMHGLQVKCTNRMREL